MAIAKIDASPEAKGLDRDLRAESPKTAEEFDVLLGRYEKQSPEAYKIKLANGTFAKQAKALGISWGKPVKEEKVEEPKKEEPKVEVKEEKKGK